MSATTTRARDVRFLTVEPGRISLHGVALTDAEYAMLRAIAERMKRSAETMERFEKSCADLDAAIRGLEC